MRVKVFNLGCKVNSYEGEEIINALRQRGFNASEGAEEADIYILNTCAVTNEAERKSRQAVTRLLKKNPNAHVYVCGCASQHNANQFAELFGVKAVKGVANKVSLIDLIEKDFDGAFVDVEPLPKLYGNSIGAMGDKTRAAVKICDGCNRFCSYCIVPYLRGRLRSRSIDEILKEFLSFSDRKEVVFTGVDISSYGRDIGVGLVDLVKQLKLSGVRKRLGSLEVGVVDQELLDAMKNDGWWCDHFHLSLQSGSDAVLKRMNRHYTTAEFLQKMKLIRDYYPNSGITTDVIAGFPEETEEQFKETLDFLKLAGFSDIHPFEYSLREGTAAARMKQLSPEVKKERIEKLCKVKSDIKTNFLKGFLGKEVVMLAERDEGYTSNYLKIFVEQPIRNGDLYRVKAMELYKDGLKAEIIEQEKRYE